MRGITFSTLTFIHIPDAKVETKAKNPLIEKDDRLGIPGFATYTPAAIMLLLAFE